MRLAKLVETLFAPTPWRLFASALASRTALVLLALVGLFGVSAIASAQTSVSGAIASDTRWTVAGAPYLVSGDVALQNGALLTIDPGVTVFMAGNSSLTVLVGGIKALGTVAQPIQVLSDKTRLGQTGAPGDWKQWVFSAGTVNTQLAYVSFEHGSGILVKASAPVFNYLNLRNNSGAAITIDLAASPTGSGNQASGNTLNGIAVPAGDMTGTVKWSLRGLPYVVSSGVVSVGASPRVTSVLPRTVQQGQTVTVAVTGSRLDGLARATFSTPGLSAQVLAGGTSTQANLSVTADPAASPGPVSLRLLTDAGDVFVDNAMTLAQLQPTLTGLAPATLYAGQGSVVLTLTGRDFVPQTTVLVNAVPVATTFVSSTQLRATVTAPGASGSLQVRLRTPDALNPGQYLNSNDMALPIIAAQLGITPTTTSMVQGALRTFTVTLPYAAPAGGLAVTLVSSVPSIATVPASLLVAEGQLSASVQLTAINLGNTMVTASRNGFTSAQAQITVVAPPVLTLSPSSLTLGVGRSAELTIQSSVPAGTGGIAVSLASSATGVATVPASVTIAAGASTVSVPVSSVALGGATISASATEFLGGSAAVNVRPVSLNLPAATLVAPGLQRSIPLTLSDPAPVGGLTVTLASNNSAIASVPASITVPEGQVNANFTLSGVAVGAATINASAAGFQPAALPVTVDAVTIKFGLPAISSISLPEESTTTYPVTLSRPAPAGGVTISLAMQNTATASVAPASITIPEGQTSGGTVQVGVTGVLKGSTTLTGSAPGLTTASVPVAVTAKPQFVFSSASVVVAKGFKTYYYEIYVRRQSGGSDYAPNQDVTLNLSSSNPGKVSVPATVTIPAGSAYAYFYVTGVDLTNGTPVTVDAAAVGYTAPATKLNASVVAPVFNFQSMDTVRSTMSVRDDFSITASTPGATYSGSQSAASDILIDLSVIDANPAGIVSGFYADASGGVPVTQAVFRRDYTYTASYYVATPGATGTYKINASAPGIVSANSPVVTVAKPELKFSIPSVTVGKGLKTYYYEVYVYRAINGVSASGTDALIVQLTSSDPAKVSVPASVTIPANSASTYFYVTGVDITGSTPATIEASAVNYNPSATRLAVNVVAPVFTLNSLDANRSRDSARDDFSISTSTPGATYSGSQTAAANLPISLSIVDASPSGIVDKFYDAPTAGNAVTQVILRTDSTSTAASYVATPTTGGTYRVNASASGVASVTSPVVNVTTPELKFSTASVVVGKSLKTYYYEVYVYRAVNGASSAGADALTVNLVSSNPSKASVPATVTIPANSASTYFYVTGVDLTNGTPVTIEASASNYNPSATKLAVNVVAPVFTFGGLEANRTPASVRDDFYIYMSTPGATYSGSQSAAVDLPISLTITGANPAGIIDGFYSNASSTTAVTQVVLRQDTTSTTYAYVGTPTVAGSYQVTGTAPGVATVTSPAIGVAPPDLKFSTNSVVLGAGMTNYYYEFYVYRSAGGNSFSGNAAVTVNLSCSSTAICKVPASVVIPAGQANTYVQASGVGVGTTTITASAIGYNTSPDLAVTTVTPLLQFSGMPTSVAVKSQPTFSVYAYVPGASYSTSQTLVAPVTLNLTSSAPGAATVTPALSLNAGSTYSTSGTVTGVAAGTTTVTVSAPGFISATSGAITITP